MKHLFILNDPPYGTERSYNALRLARELLKDPAAGHEAKDLHGRARHHGRGALRGLRAKQHGGAGGVDVVVGQGHRLLSAAQRSGGDTMLKRSLDP
jgi:hypothetical protein